MNYLNEVEGIAEHCYLHSYDTVSYYDAVSLRIGNYGIRKSGRVS